MAIILQEPTTGSDATYNYVTSIAEQNKVGLDVAIISGVSHLALEGVSVRGSGLVVFLKEHERQINGKVYLTGSSFYDILDGGSPSILIDVGSCDLHAKLDSRTDGDCNLILMENVSVSGTTNASGTTQTIINENRCCGSTMNTNVYTNPSILGSGDVIHTAMYLGGSGLGTKFQSANVGTGIHGGDLIFCAGSAYWIKFENLAYRDLSIDWNLEMHEHC